MNYQTNFAKIYSSKNSSKKFEILTIVLSTIFVLICEAIFLIKIVSQTLDNQVLSSSLNYLTCKVSKSQVEEIEGQSFNIEKYSKLNEHEIDSLHRYIDDFTYDVSPEPITNYMTIKNDEDIIYPNIVCLFDNAKINSDYDFNKNLYNDVIVNQSFIKKYGTIDRVNYDISQLFCYNNAFDFISTSGVFYIDNVCKDELFFATPTIYINASMFNDYLKTINLENITLLEPAITNLYELLCSDQTGENFNYYDYLIGLQSIKDLKILMSLNDNTIINVSSNVIDNFNNIKSILNILSLVANIFVLVILISTIIFVSILVYILFIKNTKNIGLFLTLGIDEKVQFNFVTFDVYKNTLISIGISEIISIVLAMLIFAFFSSYINISYFILIIIIVPVLFMLFIYLLSSAIFKILCKRNTNLLLGEE